MSRQLWTRLPPPELPVYRSGQACGDTHLLSTCQQVKTLQAPLWITPGLTRQMFTESEDVVKQLDLQSIGSSPGDMGLLYQP